MKAVWTWWLQVGQETPCPTLFPSKYLCDGSSIVFKHLSPPPLTPRDHVSCAIGFETVSILCTSPQLSECEKCREEYPTMQHMKKLKSGWKFDRQNKKLGGGFQKKQKKNSRVAHEWKLETFHSLSSIQYPSVHLSIYLSIHPPSRLLQPTITVVSELEVITDIADNSNCLLISLRMVNIWRHSLFMSILHWRKDITHLFDTSDQVAHTVGLPNAPSTQIYFFPSIRSKPYFIKNRGQGALS